MRALLGLLVFFWGSPVECASCDREEARSDRTAEYRAILSEISPGLPASAAAPPRHLPEGLREAVEAWTGSDRDAA